MKATAGASANLPVAGVSTLSAGNHPTTGDYLAALQQLELDPGIDMVMASIQDFAGGLNVDQVHAAIEALPHPK